MKYIRTKYDGVYEVKDNKVIIGIISIDLETYIQNYGGIVNDTIEELCDEFVIEVNGKMPFVSEIFFLKEDIKEMIEYYKGSDNIYGAIWTNKGLIYVAKMNNDGELELIWNYYYIAQRQNLI